MNLSRKKLLAAALASASLFALPCAANAASVTLRPDPPGSVMAETGEASYIVTELVITGNKRQPEEEIRRSDASCRRPPVPSCGPGSSRGSSRS